MNLAVRRAALLLALAAQFAAPARAQIVPFVHAVAEGEALEKAILTDANPFVSAGFLADERRKARQKELRPASYDAVFVRALELKDLQTLIVRGDPLTRTLRLGLAGRPRCAFCRDSGKLRAWVEKYNGKLEPSRDAALREALWDWDKLSDRHRAFLGKAKLDEAKWAALLFDQRQERLRQWALAERDAILKLNPRTQAELDQMNARAWEITETLSGDDAKVMWEHQDQASEAVSGLAAAKKAVGAGADPRQKELLRKAETAGTVGERLAALSALFDAAKIERPELKAQAPPLPGQSFTPETRAMVAELLKTGMLKEIAGTWAGDDLAAFYATTPLKVSLSRPEFSAEAWYWEDTLHFNEKRVEEYVKSKGRKLEDLGRDAALLGPLIRELAPVFVHEATHHQQDVWAKKNKVPSNWSQHQEQEAMMVHALYVNEKAARDPSYAAFLRTAGPASIRTRQDLALADRLRASGADAFSLSVMSTHYPERLSLEGAVWCTILNHNALIAPFEKELKIRSALSLAKQEALRKGPKFKSNYASMAEFEKALSEVSTTEIETNLAAQKTSLAVQPETYSKYRERLSEATRLTETRLRTLESEKDPTRTRRPEVPPPAR